MKRTTSITLRYSTFIPPTEYLTKDERKARREFKAKFKVAIQPQLKYIEGRVIGTGGMTGNIPNGYVIGIGCFLTPSYRSHGQ